MLRLIVTLIVSIAFPSAEMLGQGNAGSPAPPRAPPVMSPPTLPAIPPIPNLPPGIGPQSGMPNNMPGAGAPAIPAMPGAPAGVGVRPIPPMAQPDIPIPARSIPEQTASSKLISFLDSTAVYVQAFDFVLMIVAGIFCLRARTAPGLTILAISCFVSAVILLGFFLFGIFHGQGVFPQAAYIVARVLAPFELLLFAIAILVVAQNNRR